MIEEEVSTYGAHLPRMHELGKRGARRSGANRLNVKGTIAALGLLALGAVAAPRANAEVVLLEQSGLISGSQSFVFEMQAPSAGTMNVKLSNLGWPERLASVSFAASSATSILQTLADAGSISFDVTGPGAYFAHIAGVAQGALDLGLYSLRITFDAGGVSPVPLPAGVWLLLSGLGALSLPLRRLRARAST